MYLLQDRQKRILSILLSKKNQGLTLTELLVALFISGLVLTTAASSLMMVMRSNQEIESKTVRMASIRRALAYMQEDIKQGRGVTAVTEAIDPKCNTSGDSVESQYCLRITYPDDTDNNPDTKKQIYYAFDDIKSGPQIWLKPGVLRWKRIEEDGKDSGWWAITDGLISVKENQPSVKCNDNTINWRFHSTIYGTDRNNKGGFRFCVDTDPSLGEGRLVRIFLHGHIIGSSTQITDSIIAFTRVQ